MEVRMPTSDVHICECSDCKQQAAHHDRQLHQQMNLFMSRLDEQQRRWYAALESIRIGYGGDSLSSRITGLGKNTIRRGRLELADSLTYRPIERIRLPGGGSARVEKKYPQIEDILEQIMNND